MQTNNNHIQTIARLAAALVAVLAVLAFVLSYSALQHLATTNGIAGNLSYLWPLLADFSMIVFSLAILRANLRQESTWYPWVLTVTFAALAVVGNILDVTGLGIPPVAIAAGVKALAPVALVLAFELLMGMIRAEVKRAAVVQSLAALHAQRVDLTADLERERTEATAERERLTADSERLAGRVEALRAEIKTLQAEKRAAGFGGVSDDTRRQALDILRNDPQTSGAELGRQLDRSGSTGRKLRRELLPLLADSRNGNGKESTQ